MLERPTSPHLSHGSAAVGHIVMHARRAVTALVHHCAEATCWATHHCALTVGLSFGSLAFDLFLYFSEYIQILANSKFV
jgi:hypothetical protein